MTSRTLNKADREILLLLHDDANIPDARIAKLVGLPQEFVRPRIEALQKAGYIRRVHVDVNFEKLGVTDPNAITVFFKVAGFGEQAGLANNFQTYIASTPQIIEAHHIFGKPDGVLLKVSAASYQEIDLIKEAIWCESGVMPEYVAMVGRTVKDANGPAIPPTGKRGDVVCAVCAL